MGRFQIVILGKRPSGAGPGVGRMTLGRFATAVLVILLAVLTAVVLVVALVLGYLLVGLIVAALILAVIGALVRGAFRWLRH